MKRQSFNVNGCWLMCLHSYPFVWTATVSIEAFIKVLAEECGPSHGPEEEEGAFYSIVEWARRAKPGAVNSYHDVSWIVAVDPEEDIYGMLDSLEDPESREGFEIFNRRRKASSGARLTTPRGL